MSGRREHRLRKLEARVAYLEARVRSVEIRQLDQEDAEDAEWEDICPDCQKEEHE